VTPLQKRTFSTDHDPQLTLGSFLILRDGEGRRRFVTTMDPLVPRYRHVHGPANASWDQETLEVTVVPTERFSVIVPAIAAVTTIELLGTPDELAQPVVDHLGLELDGGTQLLATMAWPSASV